MQNDESPHPSPGSNCEAAHSAEPQEDGGHRPRTITARYPAVGPAAWGAVEDGRLQNRRATQRLFAVAHPPTSGLDLGEIDGEEEAPTVLRRAIVVPPPSLLSGDGALGSATMREESNDD